MVNKLMNQHFKIQRRLNTHTLFVRFLSSNNICKPSHNVFNVAKIVQFNKRMGKIWVFNVRGFNV
jgi:hypothetical protein